LHAYISKFKDAKNIFNFSCLGVEKLLDVNKLWKDRRAGFICKSGGVYADWKL
jgi:hypothetical protein